MPHLRFPDPAASGSLPNTSRLSHKERNFQQGWDNLTQKMTSKCKFQRQGKKKRHTFRKGKGHMIVARTAVIFINYYALHQIACFLFSVKKGGAGASPARKMVGSAGFQPVLFRVRAAHPLLRWRRGSKCFDFLLFTGYRLLATGYFSVHCSLLTISTTLPRQPSR